MAGRTGQAGAAGRSHAVRKKRHCFQIQRGMIAMNKPVCLLLSCWLALLAAGCSHGSSSKDSATTKATPLPEWKSGYRVYVTNESSGDLSIIDGSTLEVIATVPLGKRPRGIHVSPDGRTIYVALSGSPQAPPGVDENTLPPPDK